MFLDKEKNSFWIISVFGVCVIEINFWQATGKKGKYVQSQLCFYQKNDQKPAPKCLETQYISPKNHNHSPVCKMLISNNNLTFFVLNSSSHWSVRAFHTHTYHQFQFG